MFKNAYGKKAVALVVAVVLLIGLLPISASAVKPSGKEYGVSFNNSTDVFIGNKTPVNVKAGDEVYFVYTVDSVSEINIPGLPDAKAASQHGIIATGDNTRRFPYEDGGKFFYRQDGGLLDVGYTYFFKLGVNEAGEFEYTVGKSKDGESSYISFPMEHGAGTDEYNFFGFWFGVGYVTAELSHVMCYDQNGNDLGVKSLGASYIIRFEHEEKMMTASIQKTKDGKTEVYSFPQVYGISVVRGVKLNEKNRFAICVPEFAVAVSDRMPHRTGKAADY